MRLQHKREQNSSILLIAPFVFFYYYSYFIYYKIQPTKHSWFYKPGLPPVIPQFDNTLSNASQQLCDIWLKGGENATKADLKGWGTDQIVVFLDKLLVSPSQTCLSVDVLKKMDQLYNFTSSRNGEILSRWFELCIALEYDAVFHNIIEFLKSQGRMKYVRPLYRSLGKSAKGRDLAVSTFTQHHSIYHNIAQKMVAKDLGITL